MSTSTYTINEVIDMDSHEGHVLSEVRVFSPVTNWIHSRVVGAAVINFDKVPKPTSYIPCFNDEMHEDRFNSLKRTISLAINAIREVLVSLVSNNNNTVTVYFSISNHRSIINEDELFEFNVIYITQSKQQDISFNTYILQMEKSGTLIENLLNYGILLELPKVIDPEDIPEYQFQLQQKLEEENDIYLNYAYFLIDTTQDGFKTINPVNWE